MIELADIEAAAERLSDIAVRTPLIQSAELDEIAGGKVLLKPECLQAIGSFKIRGAYNLMSRLAPERASKGVIAWSSGNHAQGVAAAGSVLGIKTAIVMPGDAPKAKIERTRRFGGEVIFYDRYTGDREAIARELARERGAEIVPSYDHEDIVAGQGTVGLEIVQQCHALGLEPDQVLINCGGGGLSAGCAIAITALVPAASVHTVEPEHFDDTARSLRDGVRRSNSQTARSICDALLAETPGELPFPILQKLAAPGLVVSDGEVKAAMRFAFENLKLVVEPGGAAALAAVLTGKSDCKDKATVAVLSGGNVDPDIFSKILSEV
ncbi:MAG: threonine/serine dehydratase [Woeseia sp.]